MRESELRLRRVFKKMALRQFDQGHFAAVARTPHTFDQAGIRRQNQPAECAGKTPLDEGALGAKLGADFGRVDVHLGVVGLVRLAWDIFNGTDAQGLDYDIPLHEVTRVLPADDGKCRVVLRSGRGLKLQGQQDTGDGNRSALVLTGGNSPEHADWSLIESIELD